MSPDAKPITRYEAPQATALRPSNSAGPPTGSNTTSTPVAIQGYTRWERSARVSSKVQRAKRSWGRARRRRLKDQSSLLLHDAMGPPVTKAYVTPSTGITFRRQLLDGLVQRRAGRRRHRRVQHEHFAHCAATAATAAGGATSRAPLRCHCGCSWAGARELRGRSSQEVGFGGARSGRDDPTRQARTTAPRVGCASKTTALAHVWLIPYCLQSSVFSVECDFWPTRTIQARNSDGSTVGRAAAPYRAPASAASCTAASPTPPAAPKTRTVWPAGMHDHARATPVSHGGQPHIRALCRWAHSRQRARVSPACGSPGRTAARTLSATSAVLYTMGMAAASASGTPSAHAHMWRG
jgi:hypothetical protein